jgi:CheY-like chemotaxis protein
MCSEPKSDMITLDNTSSNIKTTHRSRRWRGGLAQQSWMLREGVSPHLPLATPAAMKQGFIGESMVTNSTSALIVASPNRIRDSLRSLLRAVPQLEVINQVDDGPAALSVLAKHPPTLMLLDSNLPDGQVQTVLKQVKAEYPHTQCLVLAHNIKQQQLARANGADDVLLAGFSITKFFLTIESLLQNQERGQVQYEPPTNVDY